MSFAQQRNPTRQAGGIAFVLLLHVGIVYALVNGLGRQAIEVIRAPLEARILQDLKPPPPDLPPPPPPKLVAPPPPYIPPPEIAIQAPVSSNAIAAVTMVKPVEAPPPVAKVEAPPAAAVHVAPGVHASGCRTPEYPAASARLEETGTTGLLLLVDVDGKVVDGRVERSSTHKRLDDAALAALSQCKFPPGTVDGKPEQAWARINYVWKLE